MKFSGKIDDGPMNKRFIAKLIRRALAEVCIVPVLLVQNASFEPDSLGKGGHTRR